MKFIQMHQTVTNHDAIGNDIEIINRILCENHESFVYANNQYNTNVKYITDEEFEKITKESDTVVIYHHSVLWEKGYEIIKNLKCHLIIRYHNITPGFFYKDYDEFAFKQCEDGRKQTDEMIENLPNAFWLSDSIYNSLDIQKVAKERQGICAPFNKIEEWKGKAPDEGVLKKLIENRMVNVLFVGRVAPNKGHLMMLDVIKCYRDYYDCNIKLNVIGKFYDDLEGYNELVRNKIDEYDLSANIEFIGEINDSILMSYYLGSDIMLICSDHEGFCVPVLEAQVFGLPIVALNECAVPETMGANQLVFDRDVYKFAAAIKMVNDRKEYREYLSEKGLENYNNRFTFEKIKEVFVKELSEKIGVSI